jgi:hypothetical protein
MYFNVQLKFNLWTKDMGGWEMTAPKKGPFITKGTLFLYLCLQELQGTLSKFPSLLFTYMFPKPTMPNPLSAHCY